MKKSAQSVFYFGIYLVLTGITLLLFPNLLLEMFGIAPTGEVWIRVVGMLAFILGAYYITAAKNDYRAFFQMSVYLRTSVVLFFGAFLALDMMESPLMLFGAIDLAGAAWTHLALKKESSLAGQV